MKLTIRNAHEEWRKPVEMEPLPGKCRGKLEKLLKRYDPDPVIQLHANIEKHARKETYTFTLNLSLPTGTLHATGEGEDVLASVKICFAEIITQCKKHQSLLRKDYEWKRKRPHARFTTEFTLPDSRFDSERIRFCIADLRLTIQVFHRDPVPQAGFASRKLDLARPFNRRAIPQFILIFR